MKASLKFREDQKPLARAKIPISILGLPFLSGIAAGDSKELRLDLTTAFESGPSCRVSYRPNDASNPFGLSIKTGIGSLGSPFGAPMSMTAEFNLLSRGGNPNPSFSILFKPRFGDFSFKKSTCSLAVAPVRKIATAVDPESDGDGSSVWVESPPPLNKDKGISTAVVGAGIGGGIAALLSGVEVTARSVLPLRSRAAVKFRWGLRLPPELRTAFKDERNGRIALSKLPLLVMNKISIEHVAARVEEKGADVSNGPAADVAEVCMSVKRQLEAIQAENGMLRRAVEELRSEVGAGRTENPAVGGLGAIANGDDLGKGSPRAAAAGRRDRRNEGKSTENSGKAAAKEEVSEELKRALMSATGGGN